MVASVDCVALHCPFSHATRCDSTPVLTSPRAKITPTCYDVPSFQVVAKDVTMERDSVVD